MIKYTDQGVLLSRAEKVKVQDERQVSWQACSQKAEAVRSLRPRLTRPMSP